MPLYRPKKADDLSISGGLNKMQKKRPFGLFLQQTIIAASSSPEL
jgi:hypothetical protein